MFKTMLKALLILILINAHLSYAAEQITVYAAASLTNAMTEIAVDYEKLQMEKAQAVSIKTSFASSSTLAKQIENGAPADIFISADSKWANYLQDKKLVKANGRVDLLGNHLVIIAPKDRGFKVETKPDFAFANAFNGRLCTGIVDAVPAGIYAKQSLTKLGWWDQIKTRIVGTEDVRASLAFVERGECAAGIVYETDAKVSDKVTVVATFPDATHEPIVYPLVLLASAKPAAADFYQYLNSPPASAVFVKYGFTVIGKSGQDKTSQGKPD